jgi:hypothetical protein
MKLRMYLSAYSPALQDVYHSNVISPREHLLDHKFDHVTLAHKPRFQALSVPYYCLLVLCLNLFFHIQ